MRTIPQIRERLHELALEHGLPELSELAEETRRRPCLRRARRVIPALTDDEKLDVMIYAEEHPEAPYTEIAEKFGTSIGRVSEVLAGKRDEA